MQIQQHSVVSKLLTQHPLKSHRQNLNSASFKTTTTKVNWLFIYLLEWNRWKIYYVSEASAVEADKNFTLLGQNFNTSAEFVQVEELINRTTVQSEILKESLKT